MKVQTKAPDCNPASRELDSRQQSEAQPLLCTKRVAKMTGLSPSFFEKGRIYNYGPRFVKLGRSVRYRLADVQAWVNSNQTQAGGDHD